MTSEPSIELDDTEDYLGAQEDAPRSPGVAGEASLVALFLSGLKAGLLTFGGAYTVIPFLRNDAVGVNLPEPAHACGPRASGNTYQAFPPATMQLTRWTQSETGGLDPNLNAEVGSNSPATRAEPVKCRSTLHPLDQPGD